MVMSWLKVLAWKEASKCAHCIVLHVLVMLNHECVGSSTLEHLRHGLRDLYYSQVLHRMIEPLDTHVTYKRTYSHVICLWSRNKASSSMSLLNK